MSESMVERAAVAACEAWLGKGRWERENKVRREKWRGAQRAAIAAMREPTEAMIEAAVRCWVRENSGMEMAPALMWRAMNDAALKG